MQRVYKTRASRPSAGLLPLFLPGGRICQNQRTFIRLGPPVRECSDPRAGATSPGPPLLQASGLGICGQARRLHRTPQSVPQDDPATRQKIVGVHPPPHTGSRDGTVCSLAKAASPIPGLSPRATCLRPTSPPPLSSVPPLRTIISRSRLMRSASHSHSPLTHTRAITRSLHPTPRPGPITSRTHSLVSALRAHPHAGHGAATSASPTAHRPRPD